MSLELVAVLTTSLIEVILLFFVAMLVYRVHTKMSADDAALYLQGKKVQEILEDMRRAR